MRFGIISKNKKMDHCCAWVAEHFLCQPPVASLTCKHILASVLLCKNVFIHPRPLVKRVALPPAERQRMGAFWSGFKTRLINRLLAALRKLVSDLRCPQTCQFWLYQARSSVLLHNTLTKSVAHSIGYGAARKAISRLKGFVRCEKKEMMKGQCVCLVLDGWKVRYRREHAHAFLFADWNDSIVFHSLEGDLCSHTGDYIANKIAAVCDQIESEYDDVHVCAVVVDNALVMDCVLKQVQDIRPLLVHHCTVHWFQLVLKDLCESPVLDEVINTCKDVLVFFSRRNNFVLLLKICAIFSFFTQNLNFRPY